MTVESSSNVWKLSFPARTGALLGLLAAVFVVGCGSVPKTYFYTLQMAAAPAPSDPKTNYVLGVEHFRAPEILRDDRIVYYVSPTELNYYQNHRWGADPPTLLSEFVAQWLRSSGVFAQVKMMPQREPVDYALGGRVLGFEEVDFGGAPKARLALTLWLERRSDHKLVWSGERHLETPLPERGVEGVASALNASCTQALSDLAPALIAQVEQDYKSSAK